MSTSATPRADARRNRAKVLAAAEVLFASHGLAVPLDEIAGAAGVGAGTVYRHFPTKDALFEAVMANRVEQMGANAAAALQRADPGPAFFDFLCHSMEKARLNRALCDAMSRHDEWRAAAETAGPHCRFREAFAELLTRAKTAGAVRTDLDPDDVAALIPGYVAMASHREDEAGARRLMGLLWDGLRPRGAKRNLNPDRNETSNAAMFRNETLGATAIRNETSEAATQSGDHAASGQAATRCQVCGNPVATASTGRRPKYCGPACRQKAHRERSSAPSREKVSQGH